jgi:hypothetical protein
MATAEAVNRTARQRCLTRFAADAAVVVLLFGTLMSSWLTVLVSAIALVGVLLYAWFVLRDPDRHKFAVLAAGAALAAGAIAASLALLK